jgi:hypothetical protein
MTAPSRLIADPHREGRAALGLLHRLRISGPSATLTGIVAGLVLFAALVLANRPIFVGEIVLLGDYASDILQTQRAAHGWLLVGHYNTYWCNHPGPFFLYERLLSQWLIGGWVDSVFAAQLIGVMAGNALFLGLFAGLAHDLARRVGADNWRAAAAATVSLLLILAQFSIKSEGNVGVLAVFWMPYVLISPFLTFLLAAAMTLLGSAAGLMVASVCLAALVHGYIPMPLIAGPVWLLVALLGAWNRRRQGMGGFPRLVWVGVVLVALLFALPPLLDLWLYPPGNLLRILAAAARSRQEAPLLSVLEVARLLTAQWRLVDPWLWLALLGGGLGCLATGRGRPIWAAVFLTVLFAGVTSALTFLATPEPLTYYAANYFIATALLPISVGGLLLTVELGRRVQGGDWLAAGLALLVFAGTASLYNPNVERKERQTMLRSLTQAIAAETPPGTQVQLDAEPPNPTQWRAGNGTGRIPAFLSGILLDLDHFGLSSCYRNPVMDFFVTPDRICSPSPSPSTPIKAYRLAATTSCPVEPTPAFERIGEGIVFRMSGWTPGSGCLALTPIQ